MIFDELILSIPGIVIGTLIILRRDWIVREVARNHGMSEDEAGQTRLVVWLVGVGFMVLSVVPVVEAML
ncbi:MAG: hypothetical protein KKA32_16040 [Actinobacteria bacterium]|nr:hypothetical protein [Actinomycetota bacterium]